MKKLILLVLILFLLVPLMVLGQKEINSETGGYVKAVPDYDSDCDYIIILPQQTKEDFDNSILTGLQDFVNFKEKSGFRVKVATVSEIEACTPGIDRAEKIRNYLKEMYFTGEKLKYVLLIGDVGQYWYYRDQSDGDMPLRFIFPDDSRHEWEERSNKDYLTWSREYTDLYYANLTLDWDRDMDGYFEKEDIDYRIPEINIMVGRIPYSSYLIVDKILHQIIDFERKRSEGGERKILLAEANRLNFKSNPSTFAYLAEDFANKYRNNNFIITTMFEKEGDAVPLVESDLPITQENLNQEMLKGYDIVHLSGYDVEFPIGAPQRIIWIDLNKNGDLDTGERKFIPLITISDLHSLREMQSVVVVPTCYSAELSEDGFAKLLLILTKSPAVIGYSWFPFSQAKIEKVGKFDFMLFERLIQGLSIGKAFYKSYFDFGSDPDMMDAQPLLLGDPSLIVFPSEPPKMKVIPEELDFGYGKENGQERFLEIRIVNEGEGNLLWIIEEFPSWIELEKKNGTVKGKSSETIKVSVDYSKMATGENLDAIVFNSNGGQVKIFVRAIKDDIPPQIILELEPIAEIVNSKTIIVKGEITDSLSGVSTITINSEIIVLRNDSFEKELTLEEGENEIQIIAVDEVGNKTEKILKICRDTIPPEIVCSIPEKVYSEYLSIEGVVRDENIVKNFTINKKEIVLRENTFQYTLPLLEGNNVLVIEAEDNAGNKTTKSFNIEYIKRTIIRLQIGNKIMYVNDNPQEIDVPPIILEGRTLLPIRWVAEPLGARVDWDGNERKVTVSLKDTKIELWIDKSIARVNGFNTLIDPINPKVVPMIINGRTMLPVRFIAENLGCKVDWDPETKTVTITYPKD